MSCFYSVWDIIDGKSMSKLCDVLAFVIDLCLDTIARKVNSSDASEFAVMIGCCPSRVWGET